MARFISQRRTFSAQSHRREHHSGARKIPADKQELHSHQYDGCIIGKRRGEAAEAFRAAEQTDPSQRECSAWPEGHQQRLCFCINTAYSIAALAALPLRCREGFTLTVNHSDSPGRMLRSTMSHPVALAAPGERSCIRADRVPSQTTGGGRSVVVSKRSTSIASTCSGCMNCCA